MLIEDLDEVFKFDRCEVDNANELRNKVIKFGPADVSRKLKHCKECDE